MTAPLPAGGRTLADLAGLLADRTRAGVCLALLDGRAWTAGELARAAGVARSTMTDHLNRLVDGGLLVDVRQGRHRYLRLSDDRAAQLIEDIAGYAGPGPRLPARSLAAAAAGAALACGRTCYDHLAGRLGVRITAAMTGRGLLDTSAGWAVTAAGLDWLRALGVDVGALRAGRRPPARSCLDWTERRPHLGGAAGAALCAQFFAAGWIERTGRSRAVRVTAAGEGALREQLGLLPEPGEPGRGAPARAG